MRAIEAVEQRLVAECRAAQVRSLGPQQLVIIRSHGRERYYWD